MIARRSPMRGWFAVAALFALLCRIAVPQGMMLAPAAGGMTIAICTGGGVVSTTLDVDTGKHVPPGDDGNCAFALAHAPGTAPEPVVVKVVGLALVAVFLAGPAAVAIGRGLAAPPPPSTGPPALT